MKEKVKMKILKAKISHPNKEIFRISELNSVDNSKPLKELVDGEQLINPIEVILHLKSNKFNRIHQTKFPYSQIYPNPPQSAKSLKSCTISPHQQQIT